MDNKYKYFAFISYSRKDMVIADYIKKSMEAFKYPKGLVPAESRPPDADYVKPIFLDKDNLESNAQGFSNELFDKLEHSKYIILLCSKNFVKSRWCNDELDAFLNFHNGDLSRVVPVFLEGVSLEEISSPTMLKHLDVFSARNLPDMRMAPSGSIRSGWELGLILLISYTLDISRGEVLNVIEKKKVKSTIRTISLVFLAVFMSVMALMFLIREGAIEVPSIDAFGENWQVKSIFEEGEVQAAEELLSESEDDILEKEAVELSGEISKGEVLRNFILRMPDGTNIKFIELSGGSFLSGGYPIWDSVKVETQEGFAMSMCELTRTQYRAIVSKKASILSKEGDLPEANVSWVQAMDFCDKLNKYLHATNQLNENQILTLPTEYQWEYVAKCDIIKDEGKRSWNLKNSGFKLHAVGQKEANAWGFYDMNGNLSEWCRDSYSSVGASSIDSQEESNFKLIKGGSFASDFIRASERECYTKDISNSQIGFRLVIEEKK